MATEQLEQDQQPQEIQLHVVDGPPELDLLFALARRGQVRFSLRGDSSLVSSVMVFIDGIEVNPRKESEWTIRGRFPGTRTSRFRLHDGGNSVLREMYCIDVWDEFTGLYDKRQRGGWFLTCNFESVTERMPKR